MRIQEYKIIYAPSVDELTSIVNEHLSEQWELQGGVQVFASLPQDAKSDEFGDYWGKNSLYFMQAIAKEKIITSQLKGK